MLHWWTEEHTRVEAFSSSVEFENGRFKVRHRKLICSLEMDGIAEDAMHEAAVLLTCRLVSVNSNWPQAERVRLIRERVERVATATSHTMSLFASDDPKEGRERSRAVRIMTMELLELERVFSLSISANEAYFSGLLSEFVEEVCLRFCSHIFRCWYLETRRKRSPCWRLPWTHVLAPFSISRNSPFHSSLCSFSS